MEISVHKQNVRAQRERHYSKARLNHTQNEKEFILITNKPFVSAARGNSQTMKVCILGTVFMIMAVETTIIKDMQ